MILLGVWWRSDGTESGSGPAGRADLPAVAPPPPRPPPAELRPALLEIEALRAAGRFLEAAQRTREVVSRLSAAWGAGSEDLVPHHYDLGLSLKLAGRAGEALAVVAEARRSWPEALQLLLLEATTRGEIAVAQRVFDPGAVAAFDALLREENHPRLRGLGVDPMGLYAQWGTMLVQVGLAEQALRIVGRALVLDPRDGPCREIQARAMMSAGQNWEAVPLLRELHAERPSPLVDFLYGSALVETGEPAEAWKVLGPLATREPPPFAVGTSWSTAGAILHLKAARSLNETGQHQRAADLLLHPAIWEPEHPEVLWQLALASRGLGAAPAAEALMRRSVSLANGEPARRAADRSRRAGNRAAEAYQLARALMVADQLGPALQALDAGIASAPRSLPLYFERARLLMRLGRRDLAERELRYVAEQSDAPLARAHLGWLLAERGRSEEARSLLADDRLGAGELSRVSEETDARPRLAHVTRAARAWLVLGDLDRAAALLADERLVRSTPEEAMLARAELALRRGEVPAALELLMQDFAELPGGPAWAAALDATVTLIEGGSLDEAGPFDPSDLVEHPHLIGFARASPGLSDESRRRLQSLGELQELREELLKRLEGEATWQPLASLEPLIDLYREFGARKKLRRLAWYVFAARPSGVEENRFLARTLADPEETLQRLGAASRALASAPDDPELQRLAADSRRFLGLPDS